ncbi:MAG: DUF4386 domain-containing protein [Actinomycetota bacterium]|nr:DUF4386 domain-containing protein [Actinomycetota bacterium]
MSETVTGAVLVALPILFNAAFALLAMRFDYPDVLREPTREVLRRFREGGAGLILIWWMFALSAVLFAPLAVLLAGELGDADRTVVALSVVVGVLASVVQFLGLIRWPFLVPYLARAAADPDASAARREAVDVVFQSFNRYLGVAVGEHLGYTLTGAWSILTGVALIQTDAVAAWLGVVGVLIGPLFLLSSLEFLGRFEASGWRLAGRLTPIAYILWSLWLIAVGVAFLT